MGIRLLLVFSILIVWTYVDAGGGCDDDGDCDKGDPPHCNTDSGNCVDCVVNGHCPPATPFCDHEMGFMCVECNDNDDCPANTPFCVNGDCQSECDDDDDCDPNEKCIVAMGTCVCTNDDDPCNDPNESCNADGNCVCDDGYVRESPTSDTCIADCFPACGDGEICTRGGTCECGPNSVRDPDGECRTCELECENDSDCPNEGEVCNVNFRCECPAFEKLFRGRCVKRGRLGGWCRNGKCSSRMLKCNRSTNMCMCRGRHCDVKTVCVKRKL